MIARKSVFAIWKRHIPCRIYLCVRDNFSFCEIRIHFKCPLFFRASDETLPRVEMDLFAFVDIIGIRAIGFPVGLTFRSLRITFLREGEKLLFPKGKSIIPVYAFFFLPPPTSLPLSIFACLSLCLSISFPCLRLCYMCKRVFSTSADSAESSCCEFANEACHWLFADPYCGH